MEACERGGVRVRQDHVDLLILKIITHVGGSGRDGQRDLVKIDQRRGIAPPVFTARELRLGKFIRACARRADLVLRAGLDDGNIQQQRQALICLARREHERQIVLRLGGSDEAQARTVIFRACGGFDGICRVRRGKGAAVVEGHAGAELHRGRASVVSDKIALGENRFCLVAACHGEQRLVEEGKDDAVVETLAVIGLQAVIRLVGQAEGLKRRIRLGDDLLDLLLIL